MEATNSRFKRWNGGARPVCTRLGTLDSESAEHRDKRVVAMVERRLHAKAAVSESRARHASTVAASTCGLCAAPLSVARSTVSICRTCGEQHTIFCHKPPNLNCIRRRPQRPDEQVWHRRNTSRQLARLERRGLVRLTASVLSHQCARCPALRFRDLPAAVGWRHAASRIAGRTKKRDGRRRW